MAVRRQLILAAILTAAYAGAREYRDFPRLPTLRPDARILAWDPVSGYGIISGARVTPPDLGGYVQSSYTATRRVTVPRLSAFSSAVWGGLRGPIDHQSATNNPHATTATQTGAEPYLGVPVNSGDCLMSSADGTRMWGACGGFVNRSTVVSAIAEPSRTPVTTRSTDRYAHMLEVTDQNGSMTWFVLAHGMMIFGPPSTMFSLLRFAPQNGGSYATGGTAKMVFEPYSNEGIDVASGVKGSNIIMRVYSSNKIPLFENYTAYDIGPRNVMTRRAMPVSKWVKLVLTTGLRGQEGNYLDANYSTCVRTY